MKRKYLNFSIVIVFIVFLSLIFISTRNYVNVYKRKTNMLVAEIISYVKQTNPSVDEDKIIEILNKEDVNDALFKTYGIDIYNDNISALLNKEIRKMYVTDAILVLLLVILVFFIINYKGYLDNKRIKKLIFYVEEINKHNYKLDMISNEESDLSILQNEIYKTMVMLRESADNSLEDKRKLKNSLSDISHQLKTPLTSILIMLDNIIDDEDMDKNVRNDFIMDIKREIININFLVYNILKLSLFDTNTVKFKRDKVKVMDVLNATIKNTSIIADLKNIKVKVSGDKSAVIVGDEKWEVEAITNIIKNSIEYSEYDTCVKVNIKKSELFTEISITDEGDGIDAKEIKNIFKRFYKISDNDNGFGIGLSLAKEIIESDNGRISVKSTVGKGTSFIIRYMK